MVDVIISDARLYGDVWGYAFEEWMGYFLLRESMLDSLSPRRLGQKASRRGVLIARDRFLKPGAGWVGGSSGAAGGALFPSHATLFLAPVAHTTTCREKQQSFNQEKRHGSQRSCGSRCFFPNVC